MRIIYFGSSAFSRTVLEGLINRGVKPAAVITQPDAPCGRGFKLRSTPVKICAGKKRIPLIAPDTLSTVDDQIRELDPDLFVVAAYGKLIPDSLLTIPAHVSLAVHPSLLPKYRGAAPIHWAIINGETNTGTTVIRMNEHLDAGDVLCQAPIAITDDDTAVTLSEKLARLSVEVLSQAIDLVKRSKAVFKPQDKAQITFAPKLTKEDGRIRWGFDAVRIRNLVRGTMDWPCAYTYFEGKLIKILDAEAIEEAADQSPATVVRADKEGIYVATGQGVLKIKCLKPEAGKEMDAGAFLCGHAMRAGDSFKEART